MCQHGYYVYVPAGLTLCDLHAAYWSEQTAIISLYNINRLVLITQTECVYCAVRTESLYIIQGNLSLYRIILEREELVDFLATDGVTRTPSAVRTSKHRDHNEIKAPECAVQNFQTHIQCK
jgi:hypothetical protein